jgi:hypothetical protein
MACAVAATFGLAACGGASQVQAHHPPADQAVYLSNDYPHAVTVTLDQMTLHEGPCGSTGNGTGHVWHGGLGHLAVTADTGTRLSDSSIQLGAQSAYRNASPPMYASINVHIDGNGSVNAYSDPGGHVSVPTRPLSSQCTEWYQAHPAATLHQGP